jgi:hypothetical protein
MHSADIGSQNLVFNSQTKGKIVAQEQRIYKVTNGDKTYLVQAVSQAQALRHVAGRLYSVEVARSIDVAHLMSAGVQLETASIVPEQVQINIGE